MTGRVIGDSYYRVGDYLWKQAETEIEKARILEQYIKRGLEVKGGFEEPRMLIEKMKIYWKEFKGYDEPELSPNRNIMNIDLSNFI